MQTAHAYRQTPARGSVVALYRGKVVTRHSDWVVGCRPGGRAGREPQGPRAGEGS